MTETQDTAGALTSEEPPSLTEAIGGPLGAAESAVPAAAYVLAYTLSGQDTRVALIVAGALGVLFAVARIARGQTVQYALSGLVGLALSAYVVSKTGRAEDFFLPGLLANAAYATAYLVSIIVGWPLLGVIVGTLRGTGMGWREDPEQVRAYTRASWIWVGLFSLRLAVQLPLYLASALTALGAARVAMGIPLFAIGIWLSWLILPHPARAAARSRTRQRPRVPSAAASESRTQQSPRVPSGAKPARTLAMKSQRGSVVRTESVTPDLPLGLHWFHLSAVTLPCCELFWRGDGASLDGSCSSAGRPCSGCPSKASSAFRSTASRKCSSCWSLSVIPSGYPPAASS